MCELMIKKIDTLKNAPYQFVGENPALLETIKVVNAKYFQIMEISISDDKASSAWHDSNKIILGIKKLPQLYSICQEITNTFNISACMNVESKYSSYGEESIRGILSVYNNDVTCTPPSVILEPLRFLADISGKNTKVVNCSAVDTLVLFAIDYSVCHEVGHLLKDSENQDPIEKETIADKFAFQVIKDMYDKETKENVEIANSREIGAFIGVSSVLFYRKPNEENDDKNHPHTIERMYSMLKYWEIDGSSKLWRLGCYLIERWININGMELPWNKNDTLSYKDKFMCAYSRINKEHQYQ